MFKLILICLALTNAGNRIASHHLTTAPADATQAERVVTGARKAFKLFIERGHSRRIELAAGLTGPAA